MAQVGKIHHRFDSPVPDEGVAEEVGPNEWDDSLVVTEGVDGAAFVRRTSADDGWELIYLGAPLAFINATQAANSGTGETVLHTFNVAAAYFNANKRALRVQAHGSFAANGNTKTLRLKFGAAGSIVLNPVLTAANGVRFTVEALIIRTASNAQHVYYKVLVGDTVEVVGRATLTETDSGVLALAISGQSGTASSDILLDVTTVEYLN